MTQELDPKKINLWNIKTASIFLDRTPGAIRNLVMRRQIPYRKICGKLMFIEDEILDWVDKSVGLRPDELKK